MTNIEPVVLRLSIEAAWEDAQAAYQAAGAPFGPDLGLEVWEEYGQLTTVK